MPTIATIGYEQSSIGLFIAALVDAGVQQVIDVRELPLSRKPGFSKKSLAAALAEVGIDYVHLKKLGDPKPGRLAARAGDYVQFKAIFSKHMRTPDAKIGLDWAAKLALQKNSALLCFEREHTVCHRSIVANALKANYGFEVRNLQVNGDRLLSNGHLGRGSDCACKGRPSDRRTAW